MGKAQRVRGNFFVRVKYNGNRQSRLALPRMGLEALRAPKAIRAHGSLPDIWHMSHVGTCLWQYVGTCLWHVKPAVSAIRGRLDIATRCPCINLTHPQNAGSATRHNQNAHIEGRPRHAASLQGENVCVKSEGVADGEVEGHGFPEIGEIVVALLAGVVGGVEADAEVATEDEHADVEAEA